MKHIILISVLASGFISFSSHAQNIQPQSIATAKAPKVMGPYSQAVSYLNLVFCSGQIGISPETNELAGSDISAQTEQALKNVKEILDASGSDMDHVMKVTVYLKDMKDYTTVNDIYKKYFTSLWPARSAVQVASLPKDALVEIEAVAVKK